MGLFSESIIAGRINFESMPNGMLLLLNSSLGGKNGGSLNILITIEYLFVLSPSLK